MRSRKLDSEALERRAIGRPLLLQLSTVVHHSAAHYGAQHLRAGDLLRWHGGNVPVKDDEVGELSNPQRAVLPPAIATACATVPG